VASQQYCRTIVPIKQLKNEHMKKNSVPNSIIADTATGYNLRTGQI